MRDIERVEKIEKLRSLKTWETEKVPLQRFSLMDHIKGKRVPVIEVYVPVKYADCLEKKITYNPLFSVIRARELEEKSLAECLREVL